MMCPVALFANALIWMGRAGILLMIRLTSAVALAATAFSLAILIAENAGTTRGTIAGKNAILSEVIARPVLAETSGGPIRIATVH